MACFLFLFLVYPLVAFLLGSSKRLKETEYEVPDETEVCVERHMPERQAQTTHQYSKNIVPNTQGIEHTANEIGSVYFHFSPLNCCFVA